VTVTTDFATHRLWVNTPTDHYTTAATGGAVYLQHMGVQSDITPCGIPIHPAFSKPIDRNIVYKTFDLVEDERPIILQLAGGYGVGPVNSIYRQLLSLNTPSQIIVVTGKNAKLRAELKEITIPFHHKVHILGFTDFMHHLMSVASVVISKPGGLTSSEVLASGTPLLITNPIPGQETRNSDYLLEEGVAVKAESSHLIPMKLEALLHSPTRLALMRERAKLIAKPRAAFDVADIAMKLRSKA
jgi:processive 1,2-diacylglycerol beta-glucosyltransferase